MTKKKKINVGGNNFNQDFNNLKFVQDYNEWKNNCLSISGESIGVVNIPTLYDFLIVHVFENIRPNSVNVGVLLIMDKIKLYSSDVKPCNSTSSLVMPGSFIFCSLSFAIKYAGR